MTVSDARAQLNQKLDQLPPGILKVVTEFVDFLLYRHKQSSSLAEDLKPNLETDSSIYGSNALAKRAKGIKDGNIRPAKGNILDNKGGWKGDDFEECLQSVYDTRSQIKA
jgi:hypothetical protein